MFSGLDRGVGRLREALAQGPNPGGALVGPLLVGLAVLGVVVHVPAGRVELLLLVGRTGQALGDGQVVRAAVEVDGLLQLLDHEVLEPLVFRGGRRPGLDLGEHCLVALTHRCPLGQRLLVLALRAVVGELGLAVGFGVVPRLDAGDVSFCLLELLRVVAARLELVGDGGVHGVVTHLDERTEGSSALHDEVRELDVLALIDVVRVACGHLPHTP